MTKSQEPAPPPEIASAKARRLAELKQEIQAVDPASAYALQQAGVLLIDVREESEVSAGCPKGARCLARGTLELKIEEHAPDLKQTLLLMCQAGMRSLFAADDLKRLGYRDVRMIEGGYAAWKDAGLPTERPPTLDPEARRRYARHLTLPEVGEAGQLRLAKARVLVVGAGGLGSPVSMYLAAAGVGTLGIIDDDVVEASNLQRQILHTDARIGHAKVDSAVQTLSALNPQIIIAPFPIRLSQENVAGIVRDFDIVVDGSDNFTTRYLISDACVAHNIPNVHGAVYRFEGEVSVFWPGWKSDPSPCYRCLFPAAPPPELSPSCSTAGVLGVLPGVIGLLQAVETIKLILEIGTPLIGRMLYYDALSARHTEIKLKHNPACTCSRDHN